MYGDTCSAPVPPVPPHATRAPHWLPGRMVPVFPVPVYSLCPSSRLPPWHLSSLLGHLCPPLRAHPWHPVPQAPPCAHVPGLRLLPVAGSHLAPRPGLPRVAPIPVPPWTSVHRDHPWHPWAYPCTPCRPPWAPVPPPRGVRGGHRGPPSGGDPRVFPRAGAGPGSPIPGRPRVPPSRGGPATPPVRWRPSGARPAGSQLASHPGLHRDPPSRFPLAISPGSPPWAPRPGFSPAPTSRTGSPLTR